MALYSTSRKGARARARGTGILLPAGLTRIMSTGGRADGEAGEPSRADPDCHLESRPLTCGSIASRCATGEGVRVSNRSDATCLPKGVRVTHRRERGSRPPLSTTYLTRLSGYSSGGLVWPPIAC